MRVTAGTTICAPLEAVWRKSQDPEEHVRWDLRFTQIEHVAGTGEAGPQRFRYATRLGPGLGVAGWGETVGTGDKRTSALRFGSEDPRSLIAEGAGHWAYQETGNGIAFRTAYDYSTRYGVAGRLIDRLVFRPLIQWATRWSFDRLRIWLEQGTPPEVGLKIWAAKVTARVLLGLVWIHEGLVPKILAVRNSELELVARSGWGLGNPASTLVLLGLLEVLFGGWILWGRLERASSLMSCAAILFLAFIVVATEPAAWSDPLGGIFKNLGLVGCAVTVWLLSPVAPCAARGAR